MADAVTALPPEAADPAQDSIGPAVMIAARIGGEMGAALQRAANAAFVDGMGIAVLIASGIALIGGILVARFMPERLDAGR
jgi:DHA2 family multidrug resistance protein-like MFS transporter